MLTRVSPSGTKYDQFVKLPPEEQEEITKIVRD